MWEKKRQNLLAFRSVNPRTPASTEKNSPNFSHIHCLPNSLPLKDSHCKSWTIECEPNALHGIRNREIFQKGRKAVPVCGRPWQSLVNELPVILNSCTLPAHSFRLCLHLEEKKESMLPGDFEVLLSTPLSNHLTKCHHNLEDRRGKRKYTILHKIFCNKLSGKPNSRKTPKFLHRPRPLAEKLEGCNHGPGKS